MQLIDSVIHSGDIRDQSEAVRNRAKFWKFLPSKIKKVVPIISCLPCGTSRENFREVIPLGPKVITANTLNFKPIFEFLLLETVGRPPSPVRCGAANFCHSLERVKI